MSDLKQLRSAIRTRRLAVDGSDAAAPPEGDADAASEADVAASDVPVAGARNEAPVGLASATLPRPSVDRAAAVAQLPALAELDDWQLAAVVEPENAVVCAAVGSGKTRVLVHKVL